MVAITSPLQPALSNRRRRVRHKIQTPAYATFCGEPHGGMLDLHEILNISEDGVAIQCHSPLEVKKRIELCLDLADCPAQIVTAGEVVWSNDSGRTGLRFSALPHDSLSRLREWLFINVMAGVANSEVELLPRDTPKPGYTDTTATTFAGILAYTEHTFGLAPLGVNDAQAYDFSNAFNYSQLPLKRAPMVQRPLPASARRIRVTPALANDPT